MISTPPPNRTDLLTVAAFQALLTKQVNISKADLKGIVRAARDMGSKAHEELVDYETEKAQESLLERKREMSDGTVQEPRVVPTSR